MERNSESIEQIFEDHGGEEAVLGADDTGMVSQQRIVVESEIEQDLDSLDEGGGDEPT